MPTEPVGADEAVTIGLATCQVPDRQALSAAIAAGGLDAGARRFQAGEGRGGSALGPPAR